MAFRFRKSKKLFPGVTASLGKKGFGVRIGGRNVGMSIGPSGKRVTGSIPGTGLSLSHRFVKGDRQEAFDTPEPKLRDRFWIIVAALSALIAFAIVSTLTK